MVLGQGLPVAIPDDLVASLRAHQVDGAIPGTTPSDRAVRRSQGGRRSLSYAGHLENLHRRSGRHRRGRELTVLVELFGRLTLVDLRRSCSQSGEWRRSASLRVKPETLIYGSVHHLCTWCFS
jgi:hypothetical protein